MMELLPKQYSIIFRWILWHPCSVAAAETIAVTPGRVVVEGWFPVGPEGTPAGASIGPGSPCCGMVVVASTRVNIVLMFLGRSSGRKISSKLVGNTPVSRTSPESKSYRSRRMVEDAGGPPGLVSARALLLKSFRLQEATGNWIWSGCSSLPVQAGAGPGQFSDVGGNAFCGKAGLPSLEHGSTQSW